jgi:hypothetical protein
MHEPDMRQSTRSEHSPSQRQRVDIDVESVHLSGVSDSLNEKIDHAKGAAADVQDAVTGANSNTIEKCLGLRAENPGLNDQAGEFVLGCA